MAITCARWRGLCIGEYVEVATLKKFPLVFEFEQQLEIFQEKIKVNIINFNEALSIIMIY